MPQPAGALNSADIAERVLRKLTIIGPGKAQRAADAKVVTEAYAALYQEWWVRGMVAWPQEIMPPYAAEGVVLVLCARLSSDLRGEPFEKTEEYGEAVYLKANARPASPAPVFSLYI